MALIRLLIVAFIACTGWSQLFAQDARSFTDARNAAYAGDNRTALRILDSLNRLQPQNNDWNLFRARVLSWDKQLPAAIAIAKSIALSEKREPQAFEIWSTAAIWHNLKDEAFTAAQTGLKAYPKEQSLMTCMARALGAQKRYTETFLLCDSAMRLFEKAHDIRLIQLTTLLAIDSLDSLSYLCDSLMIQEPKQYDWRIMRSRVETRRGRYRAALAHLDTVLNRDSSRLDAHLFYCQNCLFDGHYDSARYAADKGLMRHREEPSLLLCKAKSYLFKLEKDTADSLAGRVIQLDSLDYEAHKVWYNIRLARKDYDTILQNSEKWNGVYPDDQELPRIRALARLGKKHYNAARTELAPSDDKTDSLEVASKLVYLDAYYFQRRFKIALQLNEHYLKQHPSNAALMLSRANMLRATWQRDEALMLVDSVLKADSTNKNAWDLRNELLSWVFNNELGLILTHDIYDNDLDPRSAITLEYLRRIKRHVLLGRLTLADRFDRQGVQFEIDGYPVLTDWLYVFLSAGASNNYLFPQYRGLIEPFFRIPARFELSMGTRWMGYPSDLVTIYTGSLNYYPGNFVFSARPYVSFKNTGVYRSWSFLGRYLVDGNRYHFAELFGGVGASPDNSYLDPIFTQAVESRSYHYGAAFNFPIAGSWHGRTWFVYDHYMPKQFAEFTIYSLNLGVWWKF